MWSPFCTTWVWTIPFALIKPLWTTAQGRITCHFLGVYTQKSQHFVASITRLQQKQLVTQPAQSAEALCFFFKVMNLRLLSAVIVQSLPSFRYDVRFLLAPSFLDVLKLTGDSLLIEYKSSLEATFPTQGYLAYLWPSGVLHLCPTHVARKGNWPQCLCYTVLLLHLIWLYNDWNNNHFKGIPHKTAERERERERERVRSMPIFRKFKFKGINRVHVVTLDSWNVEILYNFLSNTYQPKHAKSHT